MHYTLSLTSRMLTIVVICFVLLCGLMFLLGMEIGRSMSPKMESLATVPAAAAVLKTSPKEQPPEGVK